MLKPTILVTSNSGKMDELGWQGKASDGCSLAQSHGPIPVPDPITYNFILLKWPATSPSPRRLQIPQWWWPLPIYLCTSACIPRTCQLWAAQKALYMWKASMQYGPTWGEEQGGSSALSTSLSQVPEISCELLAGCLELLVIKHCISVSPQLWN